ncbi:hypothetical protein V6N11_066568 [Hibiscus sabdariffa]|uniref:Uncharacterized protein n=1 Tax=Hibiscus sabdariffa TaxID=183260 RepID=A0ABR2A3H2_9ROSI
MANLINTIPRSSSSRSLVSMEVNPNLRSYSSKKISSLYEVEYSEDNKIQPTQLPVVNPYLAYQKFDKHYITGSATEQFVTLEIPSEFPKGWIEAGYSHIHFGAIRLALNYHSVEWKPHTRIFSTASNDEFATNLISKPITINQEESEDG